MTRYLTQRAGQAAVVVIGLMILTFIMIHLEPGSAARATLGVRATPGRIAIFNSTYGLNQPLYRQFLTYVDQVLHGNLGTSYSLQIPVSTLIAQRLPRDLLLLGLSTAAALVIAVPLGIYQAVRRGGVSDHVLTGASFTLYSTPDFLFAILLIALFSVQLHLLPPEAPQASSVGGILADPRALVLPVATLALVTVASYSRYMRSSAIDVLAQEYIRVARAKGLPRRLILLRHVLRNSLLPTITVIATQIGYLIGGLVVVETLFNYHGIGLLIYDAATNKDFPMLEAGVLTIGAVYLVATLLADLLSTWLNPRLRTTVTP